MKKSIFAITLLYLCIQSAMWVNASEEGLEAVNDVTQTVPAPTASQEASYEGIQEAKEVYNDGGVTEASKEQSLAMLYSQIEELPDAAADDAMKIINLQDGEAALINDIEVISQSAPEVLNQYPIGYAHRDGQDDDRILVFNYAGTYHSYVLNEEIQNTEQLQNEFREYIIGLYKDGSLTNADSNLYTTTIPTYYTDTYTEAGNVTHTGTFGTTTTFAVGRTLTSAASDGDLYDIVTMHKVTPYAWTMYVTTRYSTGINRENDKSFMLYAVPAAELELNSSRVYSFSVGYPLSISFDFSWEGSGSTRMEARLRDFQHDIVFTNSQGILGPGENGEFTYKTLTQMKIAKNERFAFHYNEVLYNAVRGSQTDMHEYGDQWKVVSPYFKDDSSSETSGVYLWEGRDYSPVFDPNFYLSKYADLKTTFGDSATAAFNHFITNGMNEGRQAAANFNVNIYKARYSDLQAAFGDNLILYYQHYIDYGKAEGRTGV